MARVNYIHCKENKGICRVGDTAWASWWEASEYRACGNHPEIGTHEALSYIPGEGIGRRWSSWKQLGEPIRVL